jgi:hypothetical protein
MLRLYNPRPTAARIMSKWTIGVLATYSLALLILVGLTLSYPEVARWVAEGANAVAQPSAEQETIELAEPAGPVLAARTDALATVAARQPDRPYR